MAGNSFGKIFKLTTFGESHGPAIGGIIDGCPAGLQLDFEAIARSASGAPATGSGQRHRAEQAKLIEKAFADLKVTA